MCVCVRISICTYINVCKYMYVYIYIIYLCIYIYIFTSLYIYVCVHMRSIECNQVAGISYPAAAVLTYAHAFYWHRF